MGSGRDDVPFAKDSLKMDHYVEDIPWLVPAAIEWLASYLKPHHEVFEWGSGGSTIWLAQRVKAVASIEHNQEWHTLITKRLNILELENVVVHYIPPGNQEYSGCINESPGLFDLIYIDGVHRGRCARVARKWIRPGGAILFDNSENLAHVEDIIPLVETGWERLSFFGKGVGGEWETSIWLRPSEL